MNEGFSLTESQTAFLSRLYNEQSLTVDRLPYTAVFDQLVVDFNAQYPGLEATHHDLYNILIRLRKSKKLLRKTKSRKAAHRGLQGE